MSDFTTHTHHNALYLFSFPSLSISVPLNGHAFDHFTLNLVFSITMVMALKLTEQRERERIRKKERRKEMGRKRKR